MLAALRHGRSGNDASKGASAAKWSQAVLRVLKLSIPHAKGRPTVVLCLGAHCDDIEIGCGGTLLRLLAEIPSVEVWWVVFSGANERKQEAREAAELFLRGSIKSEVVLHAFKDGFLPFLGSEIKEAFEELKAQVSPDVVFTHYGRDAHQDHRLISELTWNTFRNHLVLEYEVPKYDGDLGTPSVFVDLPRSQCEQKIENIRTCYASQREKHWFSSDTFWALLRLRGIEARAESGFAEAFYCRKLVI
jgi:LmbE family N-acetylglucosaminyl deacetylase